MGFYVPVLRCLTQMGLRAHNTHPKLTRTCARTRARTRTVRPPARPSVDCSDGDHNGNGFVGHEAALGRVIVGFAGTDTRSMKNWIDDLDGILTPYTPDPDCHVRGCVVCVFFLCVCVRERVCID